MHYVNQYINSIFSVGQIVLSRLAPSTFIRETRMANGDYLFAWQAIRNLLCQAQNPRSHGQTPSDCQRFHGLQTNQYKDFAYLR